MLRLKYTPFELQLNFPFKIADFSRTFTPIILVEIEWEGVIGYGEASMPPYLGENFETADQFLRKVNLSSFQPQQLEEILIYVDELSPGNNAAKASIDIALHDLLGKINQKPCYEILHSESNKMPATSFTIGIDTPEMILQKMNDTNDFQILKVKLGSANDKEIIETIRSISNKPIYVDANRGWKNKEYALSMIEWLSEKNVLLIEQPLEINQLNEMEWLKLKSPLPLFADESCRRLFDIEKIENAFHGINIKLMKSTGLYEASKMLKLARQKNLKVMVGCMSETSCGIYAAAAIAPQADYCDLDSPWMVKNNPFVNPDLIDGKIQLSNLPGLGLQKRN